MKNLFIVFFLSAAASAFAQRTITGTVTDTQTKEGMPQVSVKVKGTIVAAITDLDGRYSITLPKDSALLVFTYMGYAEKEVNISGITGELNVALEPADVDLNVVVVSASRNEEKILDAPASITVINSDKIESQVATTAIDHLMYTPGVDVMKTGIVSANVVTRGFNNIFSTATMVIVDNRIASVPSLRVNAYQMIPSCNSDIERMEVVRGPGSALYGPNAADGVFAMFTKSPLDMEKKKWEGMVAMGFGTRARGHDSVAFYDRTDSAFVTKGVDEGRSIVDRGLFSPEARFAVKFNDRIGFKISGCYLSADDWQYYDMYKDAAGDWYSREPQIGDTLVFGTAQSGKPFTPDTSFEKELFDRKFQIQKGNAEARLDFRLKKDVDIILSGGLSVASNLELTGLGAAQADRWIYSYAQARFRWKRLYFQYFMNSSNAGDTYLIPQVNEKLRTEPATHDMQLLIDKSKLHVMQIQHSYKPIEKLRFIYGVDGLFTVPITEGTINGRFEDEDNIMQVGGYLQGEWDIIPKLTAVGAARIDWHNEVDGVFFSPRAALVYKPTPRHTLRATYNRAFSSPSTLNLSLDLSNGLIPNGINARGIGNPDGYSYRLDDLGQPMFTTPYAPDKSNPWYSYTDNSQNYLFFDSLVAIIADLGGVPIGFFNALLQGIKGPSGTINNVTNVFEDYVKLNESGDFQASAFDFKNLKNTPGIKNQITQTWEIGYKGILFDKLFLTADFYYSKVSDYVSPLTNSTASVMFNQAELRAALGNDSTGLLYTNYENFSPVLKPLLVSALDGNYGTAANGSAYDELVVIIMGAAAKIPNGSLTPDNQMVGNDIILTYKNLGTISVGGMDLSANYHVNDNLTIGAAYSYVTEDSIPLDGAQLGYVALNAPKHKLALTGEYNWKKIGLKSRVAYRWQDSYPANSAVYVGTVEAIHYLDMGFTYTIPKSPGTSISLDLQNVTNNKKRPFPGTPKMGTMAIVRIAQTFGK